MPANVFTSLLFANPSFPPGLSPSAPVPAGFVWVVRNAQVTTPGQPYSNDGGWALMDSQRQVIFAAPNGVSRGATTFYWEGRQVLEPGDNLLFTGSGSGYNVRVTGYVLSLP